MKERILNDIFIAYATPIIGIDEYGYYEYGKNTEYFVINPIVKKNILGQEKIVGGVEAISKIKLFNCYSFNTPSENNVLSFEDVESSKNNIGGIKWFANMLVPANEILESEKLNKYFSQTPGNILDRIIKIRKDFKEIAKIESLSKTLK